ncbi:MAG: RluA family pseudouridine synthase [bacterium]|nr:RluA family pseudouridine synthase [bacterium]MDY2830572.1 RluA family pseudouridine synthase [Alphaproteobacteria bacterium]
MAGVQIIKVKPEDDGMRLNRWFLKYYPNLPLGRLQKLLRTKQIKVDGKKSETGLKLCAGQEIRIPPMDDVLKTTEKRAVSTRDEAFVLSLVIYKDENIIVLNKPAGLAVQGGTNTLRHIDAMLPALKFGRDESPKLVHRIDKETSGLLVLARDRKNAELLTKAFREHSLQKTYLALVRGCPKKMSGEIKAPLEKVGEKSAVVEGGKKAVTLYRVLDNLGDKFALIEAKPLSGRTHQIRAHLEYIGTPIVGDDKYFGASRERVSSLKDKLYLHAYKIDLSSIYKGLKLTAELPEHFAEALHSFGLKIEEKN